MTVKHSYEFIKNAFAEKGCTLLAEKYENCMALMPYICSCGNKSEVRWNDFKSGTKCHQCKGKRGSSTRDKNGTHWSKTGVYRPPESKVELECIICTKKFKVPTYREDTAKVCSDECLRKHRSNTSVAPILTPAMIAKSKATKKLNPLKGAKNPNWKGGITPVNIQIRKCDKYKEWCIAVYRKHGWKCCLCNKNTCEVKLEAHHIKSFSSIMRSNEIKSLEQALLCEELWNVDNGISYCRFCHSELHRNYNLQRKGIKRPPNNTRH